MTSIYQQSLICVFLVDDIQVACYKILNALYSLGTGKGAFVERFVLLNFLYF